MNSMPLDELAILNSVGEAMAKTLDVKTVTKIVGNKVQDIFHSESVAIMLLEEKTSLIYTLYEYDQGEYINSDPFPLGKGLTTKAIQTRKSFLLGSADEGVSEGAYLPPEVLEQGRGSVTESTILVPIVVGEKALGAVAVGSYKQNAFNENHLRLLQTLAANMGVAIENAHLFEETQRLLKETEQRAAELAIINSVQAAGCRAEHPGHLRCGRGQDPRDLPRHRHDHPYP
jgi:GAF domain-containing protein